MQLLVAGGCAGEVVDRPVQPVHLEHEVSQLQLDTGCAGGVVVTLVGLEHLVAAVDYAVEMFPSPCPIGPGEAGEGCHRGVGVVVTTAVDGQFIDALGGGEPMQSSGRQHIRAQAERCGEQQ
ncbi:hypothetical protein ACFYOT_41325 [Saccharothrix saharensis]|uniref:hypothetical protein n=1 Tax=Saccharothrix saharensis TaxID=571190 RepID=UPI0036CE55F4